MSHNNIDIYYNIFLQGIRGQGKNLPNPALIHAYAIIITDYIRVFILNVLHTVHKNIILHGLMRSNVI